MTCRNLFEKEKSGMALHDIKPLMQYPVTAAASYQ